MSDCTASQLSSSFERQRCSPPRGPETLAQSVRSVRLLCLIIALVALTGAADFPALAQEEATRPLERVDVEAPERRVASPRAPADQGPGYDDPTTRDFAPRDTQDRSGIMIGGRPPGMSATTWGQVTEKSAVSLRAEAMPSQVQVITGQEIARMNIRDYSDLFKTVPGMRVFTYGEGDIGHQFTMRGFSGAHGTDTAIFIDGVPQNLPYTMHGGHGSTNIGWLTPDMIERIEIIKGPFSALYGNFNQAGTVNIITKSVQATPSLEMWGGSFGSARGVGVLSSQALSPTPFLVLDGYRTDGYRHNQDYKRLSSFNKVTTPLWGGNLSLRALYYTSVWGDPGWLPINGVKSGVWSRRAALEDNGGGDLNRYGLVVNYSPAGTEAGLYAVGYVENYNEDFRYAFLIEPDLVERESVDLRRIWGARIFYNLLLGNVGNITAGVEVRKDYGPATRYGRYGRMRVRKQRDYGLDLLNKAWFVQSEIKPADGFKIVAGVREDYFDYGVDNAITPRNSGRGRPRILNPKIGFVLTPMENINIFGNTGFGFRSASPNEMSPTGSAPANFMLDCAQTRSADIGINGTIFGKLYFSLDYYKTQMEREIKFNPISGEPRNIGTTNRTGYELEGRYYVSTQITVFGSYAWVDAKVVDPDAPGQDLIPDVSEHIIKGGVELSVCLAPDIKLLADVYYQYASGAPFYDYWDSSMPPPVPTTPIFAPDYDVYNGRITVQGRNWSVFCGATYQPREYSSDLAYYFPPMMFNPKPIWDVTGGLKYTF